MEESNGASRALSQAAHNRRKEPACLRALGSFNLVYAVLGSVDQNHRGNIWIFSNRKQDSVEKKKFKKDKIVLLPTCSLLFLSKP